MTFGFPAHFSESRTFSGTQDQLLVAVKSALAHLGWRYTPLSDNELQANIPFNLSSWGEELNIRILPGSGLRVESKCVNPFQCFDWGKNKENVEMFFSRVEHMKGNQSLTTLSEKTPIAFDERGRSPVERLFTDEDKE